jgi:hypothetical protein
MDFKPVGQRPTCRHCGKELRPNFKFQSIPFRLSDAEKKAWRKANPRVFKGTYGPHGDNFFCSLGCAHSFAVELLRQAEARGRITRES